MVKMTSLFRRSSNGGSRGGGGGGGGEAGGGGGGSAPGELNNSRPNRQVRRLEFNQAMEDFMTMFPSMEYEVIECVLRSNNGAVDATIDQLLQMSIGDDGSDDSSDSDDSIPPEVARRTQHTVRHVRLYHPLKPHKSGLCQLYFYRPCKSSY